MSWSWVIRMLIILVVVLVVVAGTVVALRLTDPESEEAGAATPTTEAGMAAEVTPTPAATTAPTPPTATPLPLPTPSPAPTTVPEPTAVPALAAGDPCTPALNATIAAANRSQSAFMRGEAAADQLSATWGALADRAQASAEFLMAKTTDTYSVVAITAIDPQVNDCSIQSVTEDGNEVVIETQEVWTYDATLRCTASDDEQTSREVVTYPGQQYTLARVDDGWELQGWVIGVVNIAPAWECT